MWLTCSSLAEYSRFSSWIFLYFTVSILPFSSFINLPVPTAWGCHHPASWWGWCVSADVHCLARAKYSMQKSWPKSSILVSDHWTIFHFDALRQQLSNTQGLSAMAPCSSPRESTELLVASLTSVFLKQTVFEDGMLGSAVPYFFSNLSLIVYLSILWMLSCNLPLIVTQPRYRVTLTSHWISSY